MRIHKDRGSVLLFALVALGAVLIIGAGLLLSRQAWSESTNKEMFQAATQEVMYATTNELRAYILGNLSNNATVNLSGAPGVNSGMSLVANGNTLVPYGYSSSASGVINAVNSSVAFDTLNEPNDPFAYALAVRNSFLFQQTATMSISSPLSSGSVSRGWRSMGATMQIDVRQIPLSQFTIYSANSTTISGSVGRVHSNSDLVVEGVAETDYPLTVAGQMSFDSGAGVSVRQTPASQDTSAVSASTDIDTKRVMMKGKLVDQDVGKSTIVTAVDVSGLVAAPTADLGSVQKNAQKLCGSCDVWIYYDTTAGQFTSTLPNGHNDPSTTHGMALYSGTLAPTVAPHPVIEFDVSRLTSNGSKYNRYYIYASDSSAVVILRNGDTLPQDLSIITPLDVWVDSAWNEPADPTAVRASSIITSGRVQAVIGGP